MYEIQDPQINQCNVVHTLRSGNKVDNQVYQQKNPTHIDPTPAFTFASSSQSAPKMFDKGTAAEQVHKSVAPFPNRLRNNNKNMHMENILEMFNQVKLNVPLLAIKQVPAYAKFLKDMCTKKRKINVPKKVFLVTNISEILSGPIPVKYNCPLYTSPSPRDS